MTSEEMERTMQFILEQQAQFAVTFQRNEEARERDAARFAQFEAIREKDAARFAQFETTRGKDAARIKHLEDSFRLLVELVGSHDGRLVTLADAQIALTEMVQRTGEQLAKTQTALAETQRRTSEQMAETDERLNALIAIVERYLSGRNGSS